MNRFLDLVLAVPSFVLQAASRVVIRLAYALIAPSPGSRPGSWLVFGGDLVKMPFFLHALAIQAPRWNTHALISRTPPLRVKGAVEIDLEPVIRSSRCWTLELTSHPWARRVRSISSTTERGPGNVVTFDVKPGNYALVCRYYARADELKLPAVFVDGELTVKSTGVDRDTNRFYASLREHRSLLHRVLHHYIHPMLRHRALLPERFVHHEYAPVGGPDTFFAFGAFEPAEPVRIALRPGLLEDAFVYYTAYDRWSFPMDWHVVDGKSPSFGPYDEQGFYLVRVLRKSASAPVPNAADVMVHVGTK